MTVSIMKNISVKLQVHTVSRSSQYDLLYRVRNKPIVAMVVSQSYTYLDFNIIFNLTYSTCRSNKCLYYK